MCFFVRELPGPACVTKPEVTRVTFIHPALPWNCHTKHYTEHPANTSRTVLRALGVNTLKTEIHLNNI
jgi:hypothetical protein